MRYRASGVRAAAGALLVVAFALRVVWLDVAGIWWDEGLAVWAVRQGLPAATAWTAGDVHPPLFFWQLGAWHSLVGDDPYALRYIIALTGVLAVALAGAVAWRLGGPAAGLVAMAIAGLSRFPVWWSQELRMYSLAAAAVALSAYGLVRWLPNGNRRRMSAADKTWLGVYIVGGVATLHTVYMAGVALALLNAPVAVAAVRGAVARRQAMAWAAAQLIVLAAFAPWAWYASGRIPSWSIVDQAPSLVFVAELWATLIATGISTDISDGRILVALYWAAVGATAIAYFQRRFRRDNAAGVQHPDRRTSTADARTRFSTSGGGSATDTSPRDRGADRGRDPGLAGGHDRGDDSADDRDRSDDRDPGRRRRSRPSLGLAMMLCVLILTPLVAWMVTQPRSIFYSPRIEARYFVPFVFPVYALIGVLVAGAGRLVGTLAIAVLAGIALWQLPGHWSTRTASQDLPAMSVAIWSQAEPDDVVLLVSGNRYPLFLFHYDRLWESWAGRTSYEWPHPQTPIAMRPPVVPFPDRGSLTLADHADWRSRLDDLRSDHRRIWLVELGRSLQDPEGEVKAVLQQEMALVLSEGYGADALHLFADTPSEPEVTALSARWPYVRTGLEDDGDGLSHPLALRPPRRIRVGQEQAIETALFLRPAVEPSGDTEDETLVAGATIVADGHGRLAGSSAVPPPNPGQRVRQRIEAGDRLPAGSHELRVAVWERDGGRVARLHVPLRIVGARPLPNHWSEITVHWQPARLTTFAVNPSVAQPGDTIVVDLGWTGENPSPADPLVFAHLLGPARANGDRLWATGDGPPSSASWGFDRHLLALPADAPAGEYELVIGLYDPESGQRLQPAGETPRIDAEARAVLLGRITVR